MKLQLELGSIATPYEPYTEDVAYIPDVGELRRLPNGVFDEIRVSEGKVTQRLGQSVINGDLNFDQLLDTTDTYRMRVVGWALDKNILQSQANIGVGYSLDGDYSIRPDTPTANVSKKYIAFVSNNLYIYIEKTKIDAMAGSDTVAKFKAYLNQYPITLIYQLANEVVTYFPPKTLIAKPGGTLYIDFCDADVGLYHNGKIIVEKIDKPIVQMDYVNLINVDTGELIPVDLSKVTVAGDGLSFTIDGAVDGEYYDYGWYYSPELSTLPPVTIKYAVNLKAQVNENAKSISRLDKKIDNVDTVGRARDAYANSQLVELAAAQIVHESLGATLSALGHVKHAVLTATLDTTWTGSSAPYSKTISVSGILATDTPMIDVVMSGTYSTDEARMQAWGYIYRAVTADGSITFYATEKPTVSLPIQIKVVR